MNPTTRRAMAHLVVFWVTLSAGIGQAQPPAIQPGDLRCEYLLDPLGIDVLQPRLSWQLSATDPKSRGLMQAGYQILVAQSAETLGRDQGDLWDSGKVASEQSIHVEYAGKPLASQMRCCWKVRVWDQNGRPSAWSKLGVWSMGLLQPGDWKAKWIGKDGGEEQESLALQAARWIWLEKGAAVSAPAESRQFRRMVTIPPGRAIKRATCRMTADDGFRLLVNGREAGKSEGHPNVVRIDLTNNLHSGANVLAVGAYNRPGPPQNPAGLIGAVRIDFAEGDPLLIATDGQWRASASAPTGWEKPEFDDSAWAAAEALGPFGMGPWGPVGDSEHRRLPARMLRREFQVEKTIKRATAFVCGLGFFELSLNGRKVGDHVMDPALSNYSKRAFYVTLDVTEHVRPGRNALGVMLGNGRFFAPRINVPAPTPTFGYPKLLLQMTLDYGDGSRDVVLSDAQWKITDRGPIRANNEFDGEEYDARREQPGWDLPGFDDSTWQPAQLVAPPGGALLSQRIEPMRVTGIVRPKGIANPKPGTWLVDFGENLYGMVRLKVRGPAGTRVQVRTSFTKKPDGTIKMEDNRSALSTDVYTLRGMGEELWSPRFRGQGTRYAELTGFPGVPSAENIELLVVHSDLKRVGEFACSNELVNRIYANMDRGTRMQERSVPLDPDRDERQAWLGHPAKTSESEAYLFNVAAFYTNFLGEIRIDQRADGNLSDAGSIWPFYSGDVIWPSVVTILPEWFYNFYGDRRILQENYATMQRWMRFQEKTYLQGNFTLNHGVYGDWVDAVSMEARGPDNGATSRPLMSTAYFYHNCRLMARVAGLLGKADDAKAFAALADKVRAGFLKRFFHPATKTFESKTQCAYVLPLAFGLAPEEHRAAVASNLVDDIMRKHQGHASVGLVGMQWFMPTLTEIGHAEVAYTVATRRTRPSWGAMASKGGTSIWERWDQDTRDPGMNGESQLILAGNLAAWFYQTLGGINYDPERPGFKHIILRPRPVGDLTRVSAQHLCLYGPIHSEWQIEGGNFRWQFTVPVNTTATVYLPTANLDRVTESGRPASQAAGVKFLRKEGDAAVLEVGSGLYDFTTPATPPPNASIPVKTYSDGRPAAKHRLDAIDFGRVLRHGDGPKRCDYLGAREAIVFEREGTYYLHYDGAGPDGWLACLATSKDLAHWTKHGPVLQLGKPGEDDGGTATSPWVIFDGKSWHMFYVGSVGTTPPPDRIPACPYLTLKAKSQSPRGPWIKQKDVVPFRTRPGTYYADTASPGEIVRQGDAYWMFFSAAAANPFLRSLSIARTRNLDGPWQVDPQPALPMAEQIENSAVYFEESNKTWFLFTNHVGVDHRGEYTDAIWVYWSKDLGRWNPDHKAVVLDGWNCSWSSDCIGMPTVVRVKDRLAVLYDAPGDDSVSHMRRDIGLAWLKLPLTPPKP